MNREEVLRMQVGRKIDFLVAQKVMGKRFHSFDSDVPSAVSLKHNREIPHYSTNAYSAEKALEKVREKYPVVLLGTTSWDCKVFLPKGVVSSGLTESLPLAICRATLLTVIEEGSENRIKKLEGKQRFKTFLMRRLRYAKGR